MSCFQRRFTAGLQLVDIRFLFFFSSLGTKDAEHGFVYADQFIQIVMNFNYQNLYGFGENTHYALKHDFDHSNWWGVFARDQPSGGKVTNSYGTHPFLMAINKFTGRAFGMLILNSNAMEYGFIPYNSFSYRTLGGILDIYMIEEESPEMLIQTYTQLIGRPYFPPFVFFSLFALWLIVFLQLDVGLKVLVSRVPAEQIRLQQLGKAQGSCHAHYGRQDTARHPVRRH